MEQVEYPRGVVVRIGYDSIRNYIYWSTLLGLFSGMVRIRVSVFISLYDLIMLTNLVLMFLFKNVVRIPWRMICFMLFLAVSAVIGIAHGTDTMALAIKELLGISVSVLYAYCFFRMIRNDFERAFSKYADLAFWFTVIAFPLWVGSCIYAQDYERLRGLTAEPTAFCILILPAYYWYAYRYFTLRVDGMRVVTFTVALILSNSTNGLASAMLGVILLLAGFGRMKYLLAIPVVLGGLFALAYYTSPGFQLRISDTLRAIASRNVNGSNLSTFALISNVFVTEQVLKESPVIGNGLGSHPVSHDRYLANIPGVAPFVSIGAAGLNAPEAASLGLRSLSELGILGFAGILTFVFYFRVGGTGPRAAMSNAMLVVFFLKIIRDGGYFAPEQFFFVFIYILNHRQYMIDRKLSGREAQSRFRWSI